MPASLFSAYQETATPMITTRPSTDIGLPAEAALLLRHPVARSWTPTTRAALFEVAAGRWPFPPLLTRRFVIRAARSLEGRQ